MNTIKPELQSLCNELVFRYHMGIHLDHGAERVYVCEYKGMKLYKNLWTPKNRKSGNWGKGIVTFHIDEEKKDFKDVNEFLQEVQNRILTTQQ